MKRRCGWLAAALATAPRVVWARKHVSTPVCPKSFITGESVAWLEAFYAWKRLGGRDIESLAARQAHAFLILEQELARIHAEE